MIYSNRKDIEPIQDNLVTLQSFLPENKLQQLITSCRKQGKINYGGTGETLNASDFRAAHNSMILKFGITGNLFASNSPRQISLHEITHGEKTSYMEIAACVRDHGIKEEIKSLKEKVKCIRETLIDQSSALENTERFSEGIRELNQACIENINANPTQAVVIYNPNKTEDIAEKPEELSQPHVENIDKNKEKVMNTYDSKSY